MLPRLKLYSKELQQIYSSLQTESPDIKTTMNYFRSGQHDKEHQLLENNWLIKLKKVAPNL